MISLPLRWPSTSSSEMTSEFLQARGVFFQRMAGDVKAQHGVFAGEALFFAPRSGFAQLEVDLWLAGAAAEEQAVLAGFLGARGTLDGGDGVVHRSDHGFARAERIHGAGLDQAFEDALVEEAGLDAFAEIVERFEFTLR